MARPQSDVRIALAAELVDGPGTTRELWRRIGCEWPLEQVRKTLKHMVVAGDASSRERIVVPGVRRPVPVYRREVAVRVVCPRETPGHGMRDLIAIWAGIAAPQSMGVPA